MGYNIEEVLQEELSGAKIKVIGVGGGGGNMINHMIREGVEGIELIVANTDAQVLEKSLCENRIQLGAKLTKGLGAGMVPEIGKASAQENQEEIRSYLEGADIVFIAAGLGGGTGTGASPVIAQTARELGALTISVVTKPFMFEGGKREKLARAGLEELKKESDSIVVIPNDKLLDIIDKSLGFKESFKIVDEVLARAVIGTSGIILSSGENDINLDFADLRTVMSYRGLALMGMGEAQGEKSAYEAIKDAIESPLLDDISIQGAMGILVHFNMHPSYPLSELTNAMGIIRESASVDASIIFGTTSDDTLPEDFVKITLIATGFEKMESEKPKISKKESDGTDLNVFQRRKTFKNETQKEFGSPQKVNNQVHKSKIEEEPTPIIDKQQPPVEQPQKPQQPFVEQPINPQQQPQSRPQQQQNSFRQPNNSFGGGFGNPQSRSHQQSSFGQPNNSFGGGFGNVSQNTFPKRPNNQFRHSPQNPWGNSNQNIGFGNGQSNKDLDEDVLDVPTWLRQRNQK